ncbi:hypothetical protein C7S14_6759 [Burkholderia cepacia]|nr:hypothetical protein C7S14_6759 [Burkholderia cepacia]
MIRRVDVGPDFVHPVLLGGHRVLPVRCVVPGASPGSRHGVDSGRRSCRPAGTRVGPRFLAISSSPVFSSKKYRCKKATLQLSSYVVESRVFSHDEASFYAGFCRV